jgi:hypothetical protein
MLKTGTADLYLSKASEAEEASKWATNQELREAWLEIADYYRLLAARSPRESGGFVSAGVMRPV